MSLSLVVVMIDRLVTVGGICFHHLRPPQPYPLQFPLVGFAIELGSPGPRWGVVMVNDRLVIVSDRLGLLTVRDRLGIGNSERQTGDWWW